MEKLGGQTVAIFGLGRSGLAVARAVKALGGTPVVYDEKPLDELPKRDVYDEAIGEGIEVELGSAVRASSAPGSPFGNGRAALLVTNPAVDMRHPALRAAVERGVEVISEVEFAYRISKAPIVAITGTNGKSTATVMTYLCLKACGEDAVLCGNIFGSGYPEVPMTEAALNSTPDQILVAEISSFQLEWVKEFKPVAAGITNIWPDHLDRYENFRQYADTKHRIFSAQDESDFAVVKAFDPEVSAPGQEGGGFYRTRGSRGQASEVETGSFATVLTFGSSSEHAKMDDLSLTLLDKTVRVNDLPFKEPHNLANACMAALLAYGALFAKAKRAPASNAALMIIEALEEAKARITAKQTPYNQGLVKVPEDLRALPTGIIEGLKSFHGIAHRMETVGERNGIRVINNSMCTNPDAVLKSATAVKGPNHLLIGGRNKDLDFRPIRHYLGNSQHHAYLYGESRNELSEQVGEYPTFATMEEAFAAATQKAKPGEIIMLAPGCASTDQFRDFRERGNVFKQIAKEWLEQ